MELLEGETLRQLMRKPLKAYKLIDLAIQITDALQAAHAKGSSIATSKRRTSS
jgi:hypothetical protein